MKFGTERKGYKKSEVDEFVYAQKNDYEAKLSEQKERIARLKSELEVKDKLIEAYKAKEALVAEAIIRAVEKAKEIENLASVRYREEMERLKAFHEKWQAHYNELLARYPDDEGLKADEKFAVAMDDILSGGRDVIAGIEEQFDRERERLASSARNAATAPPTKPTSRHGRPAAPDKGIEDTVSSSGFSFTEAWNPTDDLSSIMRELGVKGADDE